MPGFPVDGHIFGWVVGGMVYMMPNKFARGDTTSQNTLIHTTTRVFFLEGRTKLSVRWSTGHIHVPVYMCYMCMVGELFL